MSFPIFFFPRLSRNQICGYFIHHFLFRFFKRHENNYSNCDQLEKILAERPFVEEGIISRA